MLSRENTERRVVGNKTNLKKPLTCGINSNYMKSVGGLLFLLFLGGVVIIQGVLIWLEWRHFHVFHQGEVLGLPGQQLFPVSLVGFVFNLGLAVVVFFVVAKQSRLSIRSESAIREMAIYARNLIEANLDPLVTISPEGKITDVNEATIQVTGCSREKILGTDFSSYFTDPDKAREGYLRVLSEGIVRDYSLTIQDLSGHQTEVLYNATLYRDECGKVQGVFAAARDMTRRTLIEKEIRKLNDELQNRVEERTIALTDSNNRLNLATEAAHIGIWDWDVGRNVIQWNPWMFRIYGIPEKQNGIVEYDLWRSHVHPDDVGEQEKSLFHTVEIGGRNQREFRIIRKSDQAIRIIRASDAAIKGKDGKTLRVVGINMDITETVGRVLEVAKLNTELANRASQLELAVKELDSFSYSVSHDLRAPLRAIDGFSRIVEEDYAPKIDAEGKRIIGVIRSEAKRMGRLIDDLLAFSRLGRQKIEPKIIEMEPMAREVFDELKTFEANRTIRLTLHKIPPAFGTEPMIRQVWTNLIGNALKFTSKKETPEIEIGEKENKEGERVYFVKDNGAGFDMRFADKLFGVFSRLHSAEDFPGTGVGLALVQRIIQRHGGRVWGEGKVDHGATFYFTIPNAKNVGELASSSVVPTYKQNKQNE